jgi:subtilisin family serine protease
VAEPPAIYPETFTVAATQASDSLASFSSRGPVIRDGSGRRKPDISAPGVDVRSSYRGNSYALMGGTSMATPHVAGVAALLLSAAPRYRGNVAATKSLLQSSADHRTTTEGCGGDSSTAIPNNSYGYGIIDALSAIQATRRLIFPLVFKNSTP